MAIRAAIQWTVGLSLHCGIEVFVAAINTERKVSSSVVVIVDLSKSMASFRSN
jgi:hypothetical protein